jgi:hypothetical protein
VFSRFTIGFGILLVLVEAALLITGEGAPFWPMWAKNLLTAGLLILAGWSDLTSRGSRSGSYLIAAWAFSAGQFLASALNLIRADRPAAILIVVSLYFLISLGALIFLLISSPRGGSLLTEAKEAR